MDSVATVEVSIPKRARIVSDAGQRAIAIVIGSGRTAVKGLFLAEDLHAHRGKKIVCATTVGDIRFGDEVIPGVYLRPTNRKRPTHSAPRWHEDTIKLSAL